jgi:hypothetical protein
MCRGIVEHVGENLPFARGNVVLLPCVATQRYTGRVGNLGQDGVAESVQKV